MINEANIKHFPKALYRIYNKGKENEKIVYFLNVMEAKLVCNNGFCISLATEWIENPDQEYEKQDCELKAFIRLAEKLKKFFPRLPICIVGDGLYPNQTIFNICSENNWEWIFTFKDGNLPSVWEEVNSLKELQSNNSKVIEEKVFEEDEDNNLVEKKAIKTYSWVTAIDYQGHTVHWCQMIETVDGKIKHTFVYLTTLAPSFQNIVEIVGNGRLRFKIENEGFNTQKNLGYGLQHKYSRTSELGTKNYYTCLQIGHMINQLLELRPLTRSLIKGRDTLKNLWTVLVGFFTFEDLSVDEIALYLEVKRQVRFE